MNALPYSLCAVVLASGMAHAQPAYTTPVGYVTIDVPAQSDTTITPPLERPQLYQAASTSIAENVIGAAGLTSDAFVSTQCYLQVTSGVLVGMRYPITANSTTSITVNAGATSLEAQGFIGTRTAPLTGDTYKVIPYWTLNTLFPGGAGVGTTSDAFNPTSFLLASGAGYGTNKASANAYFYCTGDIENEVPEGWYDANNPSGTPLNNLCLDLSRMYAIRSSNVTAQAVVVTGQVPNVQPVIPVAVTTGFNDVLLGSPYPVDVSLQESGLQSVIQPSPDAFNPIEVVFVYDDSATGYNKAAAVGYFYCSGDIENDVPAGWYDSNNPSNGAEITGKVIKAGRCLVIRKAPYGSTGTIPWTAPIPYTP